MSSNKRIVKRSENFADWYTSIINEAKLIMYTDIKGFMIFQPRSWAIWENIRDILDRRFKTELDSCNVSMPLLIPLSEFNKEKEHVEGFAPEMFTVDKIGETVLSEPLVIRPTSEILFCKYFKNSINSYKDLPIKINQWCNVLRSEKNTRPFLRNSEFHWQECHAVFQNWEESNEYSKKFLDVYASFCENDLSLPVIKGRKTDNERFAGADISYTIEAMMQDGQALQSGTSHVLGQNFTKAFDIKYQDKNNTLAIPYTTSHGMTTRIIGAMIMVHSDDRGLVQPFNVADKQIRIFPLFSDKNYKTLEMAQAFYDKLKKLYRCEIVDNPTKGIGFLLSESEVNGTPINIVIGPEDIQKNQFTYMRRDSEEKFTAANDELINVIEQARKDYHSALYSKAKKHLDSNIIDVENFEQFQAVINNKQWAQCWFSCDAIDERKIKELTGASTRCIIKTDSSNKHKCFYSNKPATHLVLFARAY